MSWRTFLQEYQSKKFRTTVAEAGLFAIETLDLLLTKLADEEDKPKTKFVQMTDEQYGPSGDDLGVWDQSDDLEKNEGSGNEVA